MPAEVASRAVGKFAREIRKSATNQLVKDAMGFTYTAFEQGGVKLAEDDSLKLDLQTQTRVTNLLGITALTRDLRKTLFEQASKGEITDSSKYEPEKKVVTNQDTFAQELLGNNPKILDKLAEIAAKAQIFTDVLNNEGTNTQDLVLKLNAWKMTINDVAQVLCSNQDQKDFYQGLVEARMVVLTNPDTNSGKQSYKDRLGRLLGEERARRFIGASLDSKRGGELADKLTDEYLETAFTLNSVRVLDRIQRPLGINGKFRKLTACLRGREADPKYLHIIENNNLKEEFDNLREEITKVEKSSLSDDDKGIKIGELNDRFKERCKPLLDTPEVSTDETIDLFETKHKIADIQQRGYEIQNADIGEFEKRSQLAELDNQMQDLFVSIANKIERIFPHDSKTNLTDVLQDENAICAGKVNILLAVSKFLGVNARAASVLEVLNNDQGGHVYFEGDLPSGNKLAIDANFGNGRMELEGKTDDELIALIRASSPDINDRELLHSLKYTKLAIVNAQKVPANSRILMYMTENTGLTVANSDDLENARNNANLFVRINPYSGRKEVWRATIDYPHLITAPDKEGYLFINSSFTFNTGHYISSNGSFKDLGFYLLRKHMEINPHEPRIYTDYAYLLPEGERINFLEQIRKDKPGLYWDGLVGEHVMMYANKGDITKARELFAETKNRNLSLYYKYLHSVAGFYRNQLVGMEDEQKVADFKEYFQTIIENARQENPRLFYSQDGNVFKIKELYEGDDLKKIEVYEQYRQVHEENFWSTENFTPPFHELMRLYTAQAKTNPQFKDKALELATQIKIHEPRFYGKEIHTYASNLYVHVDPPESEKALAMLEEVRRDQPHVFFQYKENIKALDYVFKSLEQTDKQITLYEQSLELNPDIFWNGKDGNLYHSLVDLYSKTGQVDRAIQLAEEAKTKSGKFWETTHFYDGYGQLCELYIKSGRMDQALALSLEASRKDPKFFNPGGAYGYVQLASIYETKGEIGEAIQVLLRGRNKDDGFWKNTYWNPNVFVLIDLYEKNGQPDKAISTLEQIRQHNHRFWKTDYYRVADLYEAKGEMEKAKQIQAELIGIYEGFKATNEREYYECSEKLAHLYVKEGHIQRAIEILQQGEIYNPFFSMDGLNLLADLYLREGDKQAARGAYDRMTDYLRRYDREDLVGKLIEKAQSKGIDLNP